MHADRARPNPGAIRAPGSRGRSNQHLQDFLVAADRGSFLDRLQDGVVRTGGALCVGLDPVLDALPSSLTRDEQGVRSYCLQLIEATAPYAVAFKPNAAFFEVLGGHGWPLLAEVVGEASRHALVIVDAKRGDIGPTAAAYVSAMFDFLGADACTVNGYLGGDAVAPFLVRPDRMAFVLCRTSNPGARDLQDLRLTETGEPLYLHLARMARVWNDSPPTGTVGLVVGATWPRELAAVRQQAPGLPFLIPGVGAQGGDLEAAVAAAGGAHGPYLINVSRGIGQASLGPDFVGAAAAAAAGYLTRLQLARSTGQDGVGGGAES
ncbi:MAG: orotidine-5'-phosphate decarboxylase [Candidatus Dormibacteraeota bacterium]|nr:orotidine-5'-phosphate decarboxylase [Candidatus Dormibacteraeota bacterium]